MVYDYKLPLAIRTPRACPWEQSDNYFTTIHNKIKMEMNMNNQLLVTIEQKDFKYFISRLYDEYFEDYVYEVLGDEDNEKSVVVLFEGMNYCIDLCKKYGFHLPFKSIKEYFINDFEDGEIIYNTLYKRYLEEDKIYNYENKDFRERFTNDEL
jgi:hypothetical protein